ncbi:MAG: ABC transporter substrate-binding protein [Beijerinckiaceae bacterium]
MFHRPSVFHQRFFARIGFVALATAQGFGLIAPARANQPRPPIRIISINMCTDQLLLDLAERHQIIGLSPFVKDAARSWAAAKADDLPVLSGTAEEIMMLQPDRVLAGRFTKRATRDFIRARGIPLDEFDAVRSIAQSKEQILRVAALVGAPDKGLARIGELDAALVRLKTAASGRQLRVLPLSRRGWVSGRESLMSELLITAGLINVAGEAGFRSGGFMSLEAIVTLKPDAVLVSNEDARAEDQGRAMLLHPAIQALFPPERRIVMPESLTICGGPMLVEAMDRLVDQIRKLKPRHAD